MSKQPLNGWNHKHPWCHHALAAVAFFWLTISEAEIFEQASLEHCDAPDSSDAIIEVYIYIHMCIYI